METGQSPGGALTQSDRVKFAKQLKIDIDKWAVDTFGEPFRTHLGASQIGHECLAYLWLRFRWCAPEAHSGRMHRLFQRGHREEAWYFEMLRGIGCEVITHGADGRQLRFSAVDGHYGGSLDAIVKLPERYGDWPPFLFEAKTNATGSGFNKLSESQGVGGAKPQHATQVHCYGTAKDLPFAIYMNTNKNDDSLYVEVVEIDDVRAQAAEKKAEGIIYAKELPARVAAQATHFMCKSCSQKGVCHGGELPAKNCRSCTSALPVDNAEWHCKLYGSNIPKDFIPQGCDEWSPIVNGDNE